MLISATVVYVYPPVFLCFAESLVLFDLQRLPCLQQGGKRWKGGKSRREVKDGGGGGGGGGERV